MADESIISSPHKLNRSIHRSRLNRKTKRFNTTYTKSTESAFHNETNVPPNNNEDTGQDLSGTLLIMYDSEEENGQDKIKEEDLNCREETSRFEIDSNFDPFAEQRLLVCADRFAAPSRSVTNFVATQGFKSCNYFLFQPPEIPLPKTTTSKGHQVETFDITDSELLQVCEENERNATLNNSQREETFIEKSPTTPDTRHKPKSIVDLILEDFCSSPASPELQQSSEESNLNFKFANQPLRTYSRTRHENATARKNIAEQYMPPINNVVLRCHIEDDLLSNDSSTDLSVQEDLTQLQNVDVAAPMIDLQHSQNLCENLQNLSAYFMELSGEGDRNKDIDMDEAQRNDIDNSASIANAITAKRCSPVKAEKLELVNNFSINKDDHISVEEEFKGFASEEDTSVDKEPVTYQNCDTTTTRVDDLTSLDDDDEWNDECDFLANFDMDIALDTAYKIEKKESAVETSNVDLEPLHTTEVNTAPIVGFRTASNKAVAISAEAQERANKILQDLPPLEVTSNNLCEDEQIMGDEESEDYENDLNEAIKISKSENENCNKQAHESPGNVDFYKPSCSKTTTIVEEELPEHVPKITYDAPSTSAAAQKDLFIGFRTASSKAINISKEAQERAAKILQHLPELDVAAEEFGITKTTEANASCSTSAYGGFKTASSKEIKISKEAKERAASILKDLTDLPAQNNDVNAKESLENMQFSEWPMDEEMQCNAKVETKSVEFTQNTNLPGFATASKKTIIISEAAKQKAAAIFDNLPALPIESPIKSSSKTPDNGSVTEPLENVVFSEWPLLEGDEDFETELEHQTPESNKRKRHNIDGALVCEDPTSPQQTLKLICKSPQNIPRSPLAHIQTAVTRSSLSELAVKTPPDYCAARGIISRKNLLSLNKRNKLNGKSLPQSNSELNEDESCAPQTPKKRNEILTNVIEPLPKSPPDTPTINLQEFFSSAGMSTSTPHPSTRQHAPQQMRTRARKRAEMEAAGMNNTSSPRVSDASLKRIEWENESLNKSASSSLNASKLSNSSLSNITKMEKNPTPKQRIARLRMYGKPPNVSPIYMSSTNNCRTSGLKRLSHSVTKDEK